MDSLTFPPSASHAERYIALLPQLQALIEPEPDLTANLANIAAALHQTFQWHWTGFYLVKDGALVLGPFQGPVACTRIAMGKGVCGTAARVQQTIIVPDVEQFPGHIACSPHSRSEIVVPLVSGGQTQLVLDADSEHLNHFTPADKEGLERVISLIKKKHF